MINETPQLCKPIGPYGGVHISLQVETTAKTGVEMEALTGVMGAALTVVDMCKSVDKGCVIDDVKVVGKKGGRSGGIGIWREGLGEGLSEGSQGAKGLVGDDKSRDTEGGMFQGATQVVDSDATKKEDLFEQTESERRRKATIWKRWTRDLAPG